MKKYIDEELLQQVILETKQQLYPIGSIYISSTPINPQQFFGFGEWEQIKDRFLLTAGDKYSAGATGGEATHKLTVSEMPSHTHQPTTKTPGADTYDQYAFTINRHYSSASTQRFKVNKGSEYYVMGAQISAEDHVGTKDIEQSLETAPTGGNAAHNNMPPYLVVYAWKRVE